MTMYNVELFIDFCDNEIIMESLREAHSLKYTKLLKGDIPKVIQDTKKSNYTTDNLDRLEETVILIDDAIDELRNLKPDMFDKVLSKGSKVASIIVAICRSRDIINMLNYSNRYGSMITKLTRYLVEGFIVGNTLGKLTIQEKQRMVDKKITALRTYRKIVTDTISKVKSETFIMLNTENDNVTESYDFMYPANEGWNEIGKSIMNGVQTLIYKIKIIIQKIEAWINEKVFKLFKCEYIQIDVDFYTQSINLINTIKNSGTSMKIWLQIMKLNVDAIKNADNDQTYNENVNQLKNIYDMISGELKKMENLKDTEIEIKPKEQQKLIAISSKDMQDIHQILQNNQNLYTYIMQQLIIFSRNLKKASPTKEAICKLLSANFAALSNMQALKSNMCVKIVDGIMTNGTYVNKGNKTF